MDLSVLNHGQQLLVQVFDRCTRKQVHVPPTTRHTDTGVLMQSTTLLHNHANIQRFGKGYKDYFEIFLPNENFMLILMFYLAAAVLLLFFFLSFFSIVCTLVCALLDSNALVDTLCCNIALCGSPCIFEMYGHWVVVSCRRNNKWREEQLLLLWVS